MREITQAEAHEMRSTLKEIASFYNPAQVQDAGQAAASRARETLLSLNLFYEREVRTSGEGADRFPPAESS
jgi:hypothetical protein